MSKSMSQRWRSAGVLVLLAWAVYAGGALAILVLSGPSQPLLVFGAVAIAGIFAGVSAVRGSRRWHIWAGIAAVGFLFLSLLRHAYSVSQLVSVYNPSASTALEQYLVLNVLAMRRDIDQGAFFTFFMYAYHEWAMPVLQIAVLVLIARMWLQMRSNPLLNTDARQERPRAG